MGSNTSSIWRIPEWEIQHVLINKSLCELCSVAKVCLCLSGSACLMISSETDTYLCVFFDMLPCSCLLVWGTQTVLMLSQNVFFCLVCIFFQIALNIQFVFLSGTEHRGNTFRELSTMIARALSSVTTQ